MYGALSPLRKLLIFLLGVSLLVLGVILLPLPGPGFLVILGGLGVLSMEFEWARRWLDSLKETFRRWRRRRRRKYLDMGSR